LKSAKLDSGFQTSGLAGLAFKDLKIANSPMFIESLYYNSLIDDMKYMFNLDDTEYEEYIGYKKGFVIGENDINGIISLNNNLYQITNVVK